MMSCLSLLVLRLLSVLFLSSQSLTNAQHHDVRRCAVFTITHNEMVFLPIWVRYYMQHFNNSDMFVIDHNTNDGSADNLPSGIHVKRIHDGRAWTPHHHLALLQHVHFYQRHFLEIGYACVLFTEIDEIVVPNPVTYPLGLRQYMESFVSNSSRSVIRCTGMELVHLSISATPEPDMNWTHSLLAQRNYWGLRDTYNKPLLSKVPLTYTHGFHSATLHSGDLVTDRDDDLILLHIHFCDRLYCETREKFKFDRTNVSDERGVFGLHSETRQKGWEAIKKSVNVCGWAFCYIDKKWGPVTSSGQEVSLIPQAWKSVSL